MAELVREIMDTDPAKRIHDTGHNRLPVVVGRRLAGVVPRLDVLGALAA
jgi:hypothetical protein